MEGRDGSVRKEGGGRVKIKICIPPGRLVHVGNNLIADNYYTQQPNKAAWTRRDSFDKLYYPSEHRCIQPLQDPE